jgi:hypothetical protein
MQAGVAKGPSCPHFESLKRCFAMSLPLLGHRLCMPDPPGRRRLDGTLTLVSIQNNSGLPQGFLPTSVVD